MSNPIITSINGVKFNLGNGRYSSFMAEFSRDIHRHFGIAPALCVAAAKVASTDAGRLLSCTGITVGATNKSGQFASVREMAKATKVGTTNALKLVRAVSLLNQLEYVQNVSAEPSSDLFDWIDKLTPEECIPDKQPVTA